jgi:alanine-synthesizing transaminase
MFSARTSWDRTENPLVSAISARKAENRPLLDLTEGNPTRCRLFDLEPLVAALGHPRGASYEPTPLGHPAAREAVSGYYRSRGHTVDPAHVVLSASTSESYGWLFRLLADPGDSILIPHPSYPLLTWLGAAENVHLAPYRLAREAGFQPDLGEIERALTDRTRAIVIVHPNNPTGTFFHRSEARAVVELASRRGIALIVDEVFGDYALEPQRPEVLPSFVGTAEALTFVLSGLSKVVLLPQCKLGWTVVSGPSSAVTEALARLELIADTYLSVGTPVQLALPTMLEAQPAIRQAVCARVRENLVVLDATLAELGAAAGVRRLPMEGGWYAVLEVPRTEDEDGWVRLLVREEGVIVHPGYFFDFDREGFLVLSLLPEPDVFRPGVRALVRRVADGAR